MQEVIIFHHQKMKFQCLAVYKTEKSATQGYG